MICGAADEGSAALFVCGGDGSGSGAVAPVCAAGATTPEPDPGVEGREEGLDLPGGQIGVSLLTGAKFGDRMKKIFPEFFVLDFMRTEKFREHIV